MQVRREFNEWIDLFTHKFAKGLNNIENSKELIDYSDNDRLMTIQLF